MLTLQIKFDLGLDPSAVLRVRGIPSDVCLQGDLLHIATEHDRSFRLGRGWGCDVFLLDADNYGRRIGKEHLQIEVTAHVCFIRDLATKNGTRLNGCWVGVPPVPHGSRASRTFSVRRRLKSGDVIGLPGITLTVITVPPTHPFPALSSPDASEGSPLEPEDLRLPPKVKLKLAEPQGLPPVLKGFKFTATLGGKPASGLAYLFERTDCNDATGEKWVVKFFVLPPDCDRDVLKILLARFFSISNASLHHPHAYSLTPTHLAICCPFLDAINLADSPLLDLALIYDVISAFLNVLVSLHGHGLAHGHVCGSNIFLDPSGQIVLTDSGLNSLRSLIGNELTAPIPSPGNDLIALGSLCLNLLGEPAIPPPVSDVARERDPKPAWPGLPLAELARRMRDEPQLTSRLALQLLQELPRPKVNRLVTVPQWGCSVKR